MDNSAFADNNGSSFKEEKPKRKLNIKILVICSLITILIIAVAAFFIISSKYSRMMENYINAELSKFAADYGDDFNYNQFKCSGFKTITCSSDFIEFYSVGQKFLVKNISYTASPSLEDLIVVVNGNIEISSVDKETDIIKLDFNCTDNMTLLSERSLLASNIVCDSNFNNIHSNQNSVFYIKDDLYGRNKSMIGVLKEAAEKKIDFMEQFLDDAVIESSSNTIESPALMDDIVSIIQIFAKSYTNDDITKESVISLYDAVKNDYNVAKGFYGNNEYTAFIDNFINALDGVIYNNNNSISMSVVLKDKNKINDIFESGNMKLLMPDYYDVNIESSK